MADSLFDRGVAAVNAGDLLEGVYWFEKAMQLKPKDAEAVACLGQSLFWLEQREKGIAYLRQAGALLAKQAKKTRDIAEMVALAEQLQSCNDYDGSIRLIQQAIQFNKSNPRAFQLLAQAYSRLNQNDLALAAGRLALKLVPDNAALNIFFAALETRKGLYADAKQRLGQVLSNIVDLSDEEAYRANKELAVVLDKQGEFSNVFKYLYAAEAISQRLPDVQNQDADLVMNVLQVNQTEFDADLLRRWCGADFIKERPAPVFLIGFLRSGTTLVQEVLAAHPDVFVADETEFIAALRGELSRMTDKMVSVPEQLRHMDRDGLKHLRRFYWDKVEQRFGHAFENVLFVDKTTLNTIDIGLINCVFPDAKVVFVYRDPRDVCLSCYMQTMIPTPVTVHLTNWQATLVFYERVMDWWFKIKQHMTADVLELRYEDTVVDFENTFGKLFDYLTLSWKAEVSEFYRLSAKKFIASPSYYQVAVPVYQSSIGRWRNYPEAFDKLSQNFHDLIIRLGYQKT